MMNEDQIKIRGYALLGTGRTAKESAADGLADCLDECPSGELVL